MRQFLARYKPWIQSWSLRSKLQKHNRKAVVRPQGKRRKPLERHSERTDLVSPCRGGEAGAAWHERAAVSPFGGVNACR
jgi:hypothetical protein